MLIYLTSLPLLRTRQDRNILSSRQMTIVDWISVNMDQNKFAGASFFHDKNPFKYLSIFIMCSYRCLTVN